MNTIAGLEEVTSGQPLLAGEDVTYRSPKDRDIAMVFQSYALYPTMNVSRNISFGLEMRVFRELSATNVFRSIIAITN